MVNGIMTLPPVAPAEVVLSAPPSALPTFGVTEIRKRAHAVREVTKSLMVQGTHFGTIPGTPKPTLWKAGAEILSMAFRLVPLLESHVAVDDPEAEWHYTGHRRDGTPVAGLCTGFFEVEAVCTIQGPHGDLLCRCSARANNREAKYRSQSIYDVRNTVTKMAEKRAYVSAVLMATGASDVFTVDLEDFPQLLEGTPAELAAPPPAAPAPAPTATPSGAGLSVKREAWLARAAQEARIPLETLERCRSYLQGADPKAVSAFFDDLAKRKNPFRPFLEPQR